LSDQANKNTRSPAGIGALRLTEILEPLLDVAVNDAIETDPEGAAAVPTIAIFICAQLAETRSGTSRSILMMLS
jgi:hypothetical protein